MASTVPLPDGSSVPLTSSQSTYQAGLAASRPAQVQVPATAETTHQMLVAIVIMIGVGMLLVILAGQSETAGNAIASVLGIMLLVQGITHVSPFAAFLTSHPLTPKVG